MSTEDIDNELNGDETGSAEPSPETPDGEMLGEEPKSKIGRGTICLFAVLALAGGGVYLMNLHGGPRSAAAAVAGDSQQKMISNFLSNGEGNLKQMHRMLHDTEKVVEQFKAYPSATQVPVDQLKTNPFRMDAAVPTTQDSELETARQREEERAAAMKAVKQIQLQSILISSTRASCMIDGAFYSEGQTVHGVVIEKINAKNIVVRVGTFRFQKAMKE